MNWLCSMSRIFEIPAPAAEIRFTMAPLVLHLAHTKRVPSSSSNDMGFLQIKRLARGSRRGYTSREEPFNQTSKFPVRGHARHSDRAPRSRVDSTLPGWEASI